MNNRLNINETYDSCEKQICSCSKKENPHYKYQHEGKCGRCMCAEFNRIDFGCWRFAVGKKPVKLCLDNCNCPCHDKVGE
tara:strand:- start:5420 stop:5659 length:240 start_codon:yes stop_codon:yes gene_type:complete